MTKVTPVERFLAKIAVQPDGCWYWTAGRGRGGYGKFKVDGRTVIAHRWGYEALVGAVSRDLQLDHLCRVPHCVNPGHLEPVTPMINLIRAGAIQKTECPQGHTLSGENLGISGGNRYCKQCKREATAVWRRENLITAREANTASARRSRAKKRDRAAADSDGSRTDE